MPTETSIATLRHAHTRFNAERRYAGSLDVPLSPTGVSDARRAARRLDPGAFDLVVTSAQRRSIQTARLLVPRGTPMVHSALCNERQFGVMEGLTWDEVQRLDPPVMFIRVGNDLHSVNPQGGEPFEAVWGRARRFRNLLFREHAGRRILVVSHGVFLQLFNGLLRGLSCLEGLATYPSNLELVRFRFQGRRLAGEETIALAGSEVVHW